MAKKITQLQLRNDSGEVMRALDRGETFTVTRNGARVGELTPPGRERFVARDTVLATFATVPAIDPRRFREDVDRLTDQDPLPRS